MLLNDCRMKQGMKLRPNNNTLNLIKNVVNKCLRLILRAIK